MRACARSTRLPRTKSGSRHRPTDLSGTLCAIGGSYYVFDNLSLGLEASGYQVVQTPGHNTQMFGIAGTLRHHILDISSNFTVFADVTFGPAFEGAPNRAGLA